jgi:hypothetical protein
MAVEDKKYQVAEEVLTAIADAPGDNRQQVSAFPRTSWEIDCLRKCASIILNRDSNGLDRREISSFSTFVPYLREFIVDRRL